jgi:uncharacterized protein YggE
MENQPTTQSESSKREKQTIKIEFNVWWIVAILLAVIITMIVVWRPWEGQSEGRTVTVSGTTTVKATPDEYTFNPSWQFKNADKSVALNDATEKSTDVVSALKKLGVADSKITTNLGGWENYYYYDSALGKHTYTLTIGVVVPNREIAQKVQDYLTKTEPTGQVTPTATFSQPKQKELESEARTAATKEARAKADEMAKNIGFKIGKVKAINDQGSGGGVVFGSNRAVSLMAQDSVTSSSEASISVQPGENEIEYTVEVTYFIR